MSAARLSGRGRIDANTPVRFTFNGTSYSGFSGDTLASALLASGTHFVARSFKYHRPRGILSCGSEEPNALVGINRGPGRFEPNVRATVQEVFDGLTVMSQNHWPSLTADIGAINDVAHALIPAGFYYKTFMWPRSFWDRLYEPMIRRAAGLGRSPTEPDPDEYSNRYAHCDVLVIGAGPAGLAAALAASEAGASVILADEQAEIGGSLLSDVTSVVDGGSAWLWIDNARAMLANRANVTVLTRTTGFGYYHQNYVALAQRLTDHLATLPAGMPRERLWQVRARQVVLAQGAIERPLVFDGNDRPGIMLAGAGRSYLNRYGVAVGDRSLVVTAHDSAYQTAFDLAAADRPPVAIVDLRPDVPDALRAKAEELGIELLSHHAVTATEGRRRVAAAQVSPIGSDSGAAQRVACDAILMCGGWTPSVHLHSHAQGKLDWRENLDAFVPGDPREESRTAGAGNGTFDLAAVLAEGAGAGVAAAGDAGCAVGEPPVYAVDDANLCSGVAQSAPLAGRAFVDFQNDVTAKDIRLAVREGFHSIEHVKRYTTTGMATDQGKTSNINGMTIAAEAVGKPVPAVGLTTFRPPYTPVTFGTLAHANRGALFDVTRPAPMDEWAEAQGAIFEPVGQWRRARYFPRADEDMDVAVARECRATRRSLGIMDASTLGKIEVVGPDAAEFVDRMYAGPFAKLAVGRCRYGLMLGEDGFIMDDGVIGRLAEDRFHVTTTTGGAAHVLAVMEDYRQTEWPDLAVWLTSVTEQWAVIAVNGPNARTTLAPLIEGIDLDKDAFPHMAVREGQVRGVPIRLFRVSFTGELGFEVNVPARYGQAVWNAVMDAGADAEITPYGTEAMHVLRAEKGYIIVGQDTDGTVTPADAGMAWAVGKKKADFVGKRSLSRPDIVAPGRKQLVGLLPVDPSVVLEEGAQITALDEPRRPIGHVTSSYRSTTLDRSIAMAMVESGHDRMDEELSLPGSSGARVTVTGTVFYDPEGVRLNV
jgi:sarcosine oxidase subunit alpha